MTNQEILANAPDGATHYECGEYQNHIHDGNWVYWSKAVGWEKTKPEEDSRSLEDVKRIVELENALITLLEATSDLEEDDPCVAVAEGNARRVLED